MKTFAILLGFVLLCSSAAFADKSFMTDTDYWVGKWCTGWASGDSPQAGCPIQLNLTKEGETLTGKDIHSGITTTYNEIKVTRDATGKTLYMNGSWKQPNHNGIFGVALNMKTLKSFNGTWKDTDENHRPDGGKYWGIALDLCPDEKCPEENVKKCPFKR